MHVYQRTCQHTHRHTHTYTIIIQTNKQTLQQKLKLKQSSQIQKLSFTDRRKKQHENLNHFQSTVLKAAVSCVLKHQSSTSRLETWGVKRNHSSQEAATTQKMGGGKCLLSRGTSLCVEIQLHTLHKILCAYVCVYEYMPSVCGYPQSPEEGIRSREAGVTGSCEQPIWVLGTKSGPLSRAGNSLKH